MSCQIIAEYESLGGFHSTASTPELAELQRRAEEWTLVYESRVDSLSAGEALQQLGDYDILHRIAFGKAPRKEFINGIKLRAFDAYMRGDKTVDIYILHSAIACELRNRNVAFIGAPLDWHCRMIDRWHRQFRRGFTLEPLRDYDTASRVRALLAADLRPYEGSNEAAYKRTLSLAHTSLLNTFSTRVEDPSLSFAVNR